MHATLHWRCETIAATFLSLPRFAVPVILVKYRWPGRVVRLVFLQRALRRCITRRRVMRCWLLRHLIRCNHQQITAFLRHFQVGARR
jgi:hypothetical protein